MKWFNRKRDGWQTFRKSYPAQNVGGLDEWNRRCPERYREDIMQLADRLPHTCLTCWWLQFKDGVSNRGCRYAEFMGEQLPFRSIPEACTWNCLGWRVDPHADKRVQGFQGFIM